MLSGQASLVLLGLRGSGKTTLARLLSDELSRPWHDLDDLTPKLLNCSSAAEAIGTHGLPAFRLAETQALRTHLDSARVPCVLALGGGTPTAPGAIELLREARDLGQIRMVYLRGGVGTLRERLRTTDLSTRPSLTGQSALDEVWTLHAQRDGVYSWLADVTIEVDGRDARDVVLGILRALSSRR